MLIWNILQFINGKKTPEDECSKSFEDFRALPSSYNDKTKSTNFEMLMALKRAVVKDIFAVE